MVLLPLFPHLSYYYQTTPTITPNSPIPQCHQTIPMKLLPLIAFLFLLVAPKIVDKTVSLSVFQKGFGWFYLTKLTLSPGTTTISLTTTINGQPTSTLEEIEFCSIIDTHWDEELANKCDTTPLISHNHTLRNDNQPTHSKFDIGVPEEHIYYFVMKDCKHRITRDYTNLHVLMDVRLEVINNGSHLGEEDNWVIFPILFLTITWLVWRISRNNPWKGEKDWAQIMILVGILTRTGALAFKGLGFLLYLTSGQEWILFEVGYMALHSVSQSIMMSLLIFVAFGWTIHYASHQDFDIFVPLACMIGFIKMVISVLGILNHDSHDRYHMYDSVPGFIQLIIRLMVYLVFVGGVIYSHKTHNNSKRFSGILYVCGSVYILSLPLMLILTTFHLSKIDQQELVFVGGELLELMTNLLLTYLVTSKGSLYQKVAWKNKSFIGSKESKLF